MPMGGSGVSSGPAPSPPEGPAPPPDYSNQGLNNLINLDTQNANNLTEDASKYLKNLPGTIGSQTDTAVDHAKTGLASDMQSIKASDNARGLLYSGIPGSDTANAAATRGSALGSNIQSINQTAQNTLDQKQQLALSAQQQAETDKATYDTNQANYEMQQYQLALQEQQNQNEYYASMMQGGFGAAGLGIGLLGLFV